MALMKYPTGIQYFPDIIEGGYVYVDKTKYIRMLESSGKQYFLSRPRRFGKSLFISTLEARFEGRRELFRGLSIDTDDTDWTPRPVIKIALNGIDAKSQDSLVNTLNCIFREYENLYEIPDCGYELSSRFELILKTAYLRSGRKTAVLIDEYDAPLLQTLENEELNISYRETLKSVFSILKNADRYIHFTFVTGVSRFSHTSLFSGANHLDDISLLNQYSAICGITEDELKENFKRGIHEFAETLHTSDSDILARLKENYDGYHFSAVSPDIYNPFSLLFALKNMAFDDYWFKSGTPSYLVQALKHDGFYLPELDCLETVASGLSAKESYLQNPVALLFEAGYITIKDYDDESQLYTLALPNHEIAVSFSDALLPIYSNWDQDYCRQSTAKMRKAIFAGHPEDFMRHLQTFLEGNPYSNTELSKREKYFKNNIFIVFKSLGFMPRVEEETCSARMDVMLRTRRFIYIFELKTDGSVCDARTQIERRGYARPYADEQRRIIRIAANYSSARNNIDSWLISE